MTTARSRATRRTDGAFAARLLRRLESLRLTHGAPAAAEKGALLSALERAQLRSAREVLRLHEALVFLRAYPDDALVLARVERMLAAFARRRDLRVHRTALEDSGLAGTDIRFRFFAATALRLARRWPGQLRYDWDAFDDATRLEELLPLLIVDAESPGLDEYDYGLRGWLARMKGPREGDAAFVTQRLGARIADPVLYERVFDGVDAPMVLHAGPDTPSRTRAHWPRPRVHFQRAPLGRGRPDLAAELARPPRSIRSLAPRDGRRMLDLAMEAMVTRSRDLDVFAYGDPNDVRLVDCGDGLEFACIGALPSRRLLLESVYGFLTLKNGVPTGYVLTSALYGSSEIAYNVFETYRGAEAGAVYGRVLAMTRHLFRVDSFTIYPYQLGDGNDEAIDSGAWWFYRKLGFEPRDPGARRVMRAEEQRMRRDSAHRSSRSTLRQLAKENVYWHLGPPREDVIGLLPLANAGLAVGRMLAKRFGAAQGRGADACTREAAALLGGGPGRGWSRDERRAFDRWAPLVLLLPGVSRWSAAERRALLAVIRAKGGRRETDFVHRFDAHRKLRRALATLVQSTSTD